jgi:hypothetical protein
MQNILPKLDLPSRSAARALLPVGVRVGGVFEMEKTA